MTIMRILLFLLCFSPAFSAAPAQNIDAITRAINDGDAATLGKYFDKMVEIAILDDEMTYSKSDAIQKVKSFFGQSRPTNFRKVHEGTSKGRDSQYCIGNLSSSAGTYRVYIYLSLENGSALIQELRFDRA